MSVARTEDAITKQIDAAMDAINTEGSRYPGLSYEEGVDSALRWALGWSDDAPMEDK